MPGRLDPWSRAPRGRPGTIDAVVPAARLDAPRLAATVALLAPAGAFVAGPPLAALVRAAAAGAALPHLGEALGRSLAVALASTAVTLVLAVPLAGAVVEGGRLVAALVRLPLLAPPFAPALAVVLLSTPGGPLAGAVPRQGASVLVAAQVLTFLPHACVLLAGVLRRIDPDLLAAAESAGASRVAALRRIALPLAARGLAVTALALLAFALGDLAGPLLLGGGVPMLSTQAYLLATAGRDPGAAAVLAAIAAVPGLAAYAAGAPWLGQPALLEPAPAPRWPAHRHGRLTAILALPVAGLVALPPVLVLLGASARARELDGWPSLDHLAAGLAPLGRSVLLGLAAGLAGTVVALGTALAARCVPAPGLVERLSLLGAALPGGLLGAGYALALGSGRPGAGATFAVLTAAVVAWALPGGVLVGRAARLRLEPALQEAAASLGAGRLLVWRRIALPLLREPAARIFGYFFAGALVTVTALAFLAVPGREPAAVAGLELAARGAAGPACVQASLVLLAGLAALAPAGVRRVPLALSAR